MTKIKSFTSFLPPAIIKIGDKTFIVPNYIEVPNETTLDEVRAVWSQEQPKPAPGMYCSNEDMELYLAGKFKVTVDNTADVVEIVPASKGNKSYTVANKNGDWSCTCVGYSYRRRCRHIDEVKTKQNIT